MTLCTTCNKEARKGQRLPGGDFICKVCAKERQQAKQIARRKR